LNWTNKKILMHFDNLFYNSKQFTSKVSTVPELRTFMDLISYNFDPGVNHKNIDSESRDLKKQSSIADLYIRTTIPLHQTLTGSARATGKGDVDATYSTANT